MEPGPPGWNSEWTALKPFTYPVPETRFIHAGMNVYKFKIKYGNTVGTNIGLHGNIVNKELEEAIRVTLGNLNNLHPFTTEHLVIFPYLSKWEKASDLRFKQGDTFLFPYPYVCIVYAELNSRQKRLFLDETEYRGACNFNLPEEIQLRCCGAAIVNCDTENVTLEYVMAENSDHGLQDEQMPVLPQGPEERTEWKNRGFLALLKSTLFPPLLQRIFSGISKSS